MNFFKKEEPVTPKEVLDYVKKLEKKIDSLSIELERLKEESRFSIKKIAIKRYNPFPGVGGNQSFSIVLLDENNDGLIVSSLFAPSGNRVYAKPVKKGKTEYQLSEEEEEIIAQVINPKSKK